MLVAVQVQPLINPALKPFEDQSGWRGPGTAGDLGIGEIHRVIHVILVPLRAGKLQSELRFGAAGAQVGEDPVGHQ